MNTLAPWAQQLARALLQQPLRRRWAHVQGVAARARSPASVLGAHADLLDSAAWLHDIGYAPGLAATGFHPLDGARYLRDTQHAGQRLCRLVAHHSCAIIEAGERGLAGFLRREFEPPPGSGRSCAMESYRRVAAPQPPPSRITCGVCQPFKITVPGIDTEEDHLSTDNSVPNVVDVGLASSSK